MGKIMKVNRHTAGKRTIITKGAIFLVWLTITIFTSAAWAGSYSGGSGTEADPYQISTAEDMQAIGPNEADWDKHFLLTADIDLSAYTGTEFNIIGRAFPSFTGVFDGNDHTISNFTYSTTNTDDLGLFGYINGPNALIKDLTLVTPNVSAADNSDSVASLVGWLRNGTVTGCGVEGGSVTGRSSTGGLVGYNYSYGMISNCHATASVTGEGDYTGGLVGHNRGAISNCYAAGSVMGTDFTGGLVGNHYLSPISSCYSSASVSGADNTGGLVGQNSIGPISNSYAAGSVIGHRFTGGLVGHNYHSTISNCYAIASVSGADYTGGLVGIRYLDTISASFWDIETTGQSSSAGGEGKTTAQMQTKTTFTDAGWDFLAETVNGIEDIWRLCEDGIDYPKLAWQMIMLGDFVCGDGVRFNDLDIFMKQWLMEKLSADVSPARGDGMVDFLDWAVFANTLQNTVDLNDVAVFAGQWLRLGAYCADIAPSPGGDGVVDMLDFAVLGEHWLGGPG